MTKDSEKCDGWTQQVVGKNKILSMAAARVIEKNDIVLQVLFEKHDHVE